MIVISKAYRPVFLYIITESKLVLYVNPIFPLNAITYAHLPPQQENYYIRVKKILSFH